MIICLKPPISLAKDLSKIEVSGKKSEVGDMHITLFFFKEENIKLYIKALTAVNKVTKNYKAFDIRLEELTSFPPSKSSDNLHPVIIKIDSPELMKLRKAISKELDKAKLNYSKDFKEYIPHLTLSYNNEKPGKKKLKEDYSFVVNETQIWDELGNKIPIKF